MTPNPSSRPFIRERAIGPFWYAKWSRNGRPVIRALGRAWVESDGNGGWRRRRGRAPEGVLTEAMAAERMLALVREHDAEQTLLERDAEGRRWRGVTFRELAVEYLEWLEHVKGAKPSTLRDHRLLLAEPGQAYRRGQGYSRGVVMVALGDRPAREVTTREVEDLLRLVSATGVAPRTVNKVHQLVCAIFNYGTRPSTYCLPNNPAVYADRRREPERGPLAFYSPEQVEALVNSFAGGGHRDPSRPPLSPEEIEARAREDVQDAHLVRVVAYAGLRRGELVALRWRDIDFAGRKIIVRRAVSGDTELRSTESRRFRQVPLPDQAAGALDRLSRRGEFIGPDDYVFAKPLRAPARSVSAAPALRASAGCRRP